MELFVKTAVSWKILAIFAKRSILDIWQGYENACGCRDAMQKCIWIPYNNNICLEWAKNLFHIVQAFIGLSFSFGFITGPLIGAYFASKSHLPDYDSSNIFAFTAQIAVVIQLITLLIVVSLLDETSGLKEVN